MDDPALREGLPLKQEAWQPYLDTAVAAFRMTCGVAKPETQMWTHFCYSDFEDILPAIDAMDGAAPPPSTHLEMGAHAEP